MVPCARRTQTNNSSSACCTFELHRFRKLSLRSLSLGLAERQLSSISVRTRNCGHARAGHGRARSRRIFVNNRPSAEPERPAHLFVGRATPLIPQHGVSFPAHNAHPRSDQAELEKWCNYFWAHGTSLVRVFGASVQTEQFQSEIVVSSGPARFRLFALDRVA